MEFIIFNNLRYRYSTINDMTVRTNSDDILCFYLRFEDSINEDTFINFLSDLTEKEILDIYESCLYDDNRITGRNRNL